MLSEPLQIIINQSLNNGIFPDKLKMAKIFPIFKKGNKHNIKNYRPISLLTSISKVFERAVFDQVFSYFAPYLCDNQYGFRKPFDSLIISGSYGGHRQHTTDKARSMA